jgi:hypothetical protein
MRHGLGCVADRGSITLIIFLVFRCAGAGLPADGGGPLGALLVAVISLSALRLWKWQQSVLRLFLLTLSVLMLLWVCAQMAREAVDQSDDWGHVARDFAWPQLWRPIIAVVGIVGYALTIGTAARMGQDVAEGSAMRLIVPYLSTPVTAVCLGGLWHGDRAA